MKSKLFSLILFLIAVILGGIYYWQFYRKDSVDILSSVSLASGEALIFIDFGPKGSKRFFKGEIMPNMTLLDALRVSAEVGNIELEIEGEAGAEKIVKINGLQNGKDGGRWNYYLGEKRIENPLSIQMVNPGDRFKFVYESR